MNREEQGQCLEQEQRMAEAVFDAEAGKRQCLVQEQCPGQCLVQEEGKGLWQ
jgi:hypothetical protein